MVASVSPKAYIYPRHNNGVAQLVSRINVRIKYKKVVKRYIAAVKGRLRRRQFIIAIGETQ